MVEINGGPSTVEKIPTNSEKTAPLAKMMLLSSILEANVKPTFPPLLPISHTQNSCSYIPSLHSFFSTQTCFPIPRFEFPHTNYSLSLSLS